MKGLNERVANEIKGLEKEEGGRGGKDGRAMKNSESLLEIYPSNFFPE